MVPSFIKGTETVTGRIDTAFSVAGLSPRSAVGISIAARLERELLPPPDHVMRWLENCDIYSDGTLARFKSTLERVLAVRGLC